MRLLSLAACAMLLLCDLVTPRLAHGIDLPPGFTAVPITPVLNKPVSISFAPDGRLFVAEKRGTVRVYKNKKKISTFIDLRDEVNNSEELGMLAVAVDPKFDSNGYVYFLYTADVNPGPPDDPADAGAFSRLTRYKADKNISNKKAKLSTRKVLIGKSPGSGFPACYSSHTIGDLEFAPDGTLLVSSGDGASYVGADGGGITPWCFEDGLFSSAQDIGAFRSQNLNSPDGKLLRIKRDGKAPSNNPYFEGSSTSHKSRIWSYGLRNPFRIAVRSEGSGSIIPPVYVGDVGWDTYEEVNIARGGENFGWPCKEGPNVAPIFPSLSPSNSGCNTLNTSANPGPVRLPVIYYHLNNPALSKPVGLGGRSITLGKFYEANKYPDTYQGGLFFGDFIEGWIKVLKVSPIDNFISVLEFADNAGRPVDFAIHPQTGDVCYIDWDSQRVYQIKYTGDSNLMAFGAPTGGEFEPTVVGCPADIAPRQESGEFGDGQVDTNDMLMVIERLGQQMDIIEDGDADVAPLPDNGDGVVTADDLLAVMNAWGPC